MPKLSRPRHGSLQYWPRKRASKMLPRVNWEALYDKSGVKGVLGIIGYKVGMTTVIAKDQTPNSMTKEKKVAIPSTIIEVPPMKIMSVRLYKNNKVLTELWNDNLDKELKKLIKVNKKKSEGIKGKIEEISTKINDYDDVRIIVYSVVKKTGIKKKPNIIEIGINGTMEEKIGWIKENINKEIPMSEIMSNYDLVDIRGLTRGKGLVGPVKRYGLDLKAHKSEKGVRRPGSLGPWHPARVTFKAPQAGQLGMFTRTTHNNKIIKIGSVEKDDINPNEGFKKYGKIRTEYIIIRGSVQGPNKRALLVTAPLRKTKKQVKKKYEYINLEL